LHIRVDTVLVKEVDGVNVEALEGGFGDGTNIFRSTVRSHHHLARGFAAINLEAELGGNHHPVTIRLQALAEENFVRVGPINFRRIEKCNAEVNSAMQRRDRTAFIARRAIGMGHSHATEAERRYGQIVSKGSAFHLFVLP